MGQTIDLNSDMAEGFGPWTMGDDAAMLDIVSSANIACGFHAGDPVIMAETMRLAAARGVTVGAHPGFPDLWGFGRRQIPFSTSEIERLVAYQIGAAQGMAALVGEAVRYVKPHGALANLAHADRAVADAIARAIAGVDRSLGWLAIALGEQERAGRDAGLTVYSEIFADRAYEADGALVDRRKPGAVLHDPAEAADRVVRMVRQGGLETVGGGCLTTPIHSICVHGDTPAAVGIAAAVRQGLERAGIGIRRFVP